MASTAPATNILNGYPIRNYDTTDPGAVALANEIKGGHHQYQTLAERDAIPDERREIGMECYVGDTGITYVLAGGITNDLWTDVLNGADSRIDAVEFELGNKADSDLGNVPDGTVGTPLLGLASVTLAKLASDVVSVLGGGLDATKYQGLWDASTNTPTIPTASGNAQEWYQVSVAGTATGNAAGTYVVGDKIVSDGTNWLKMIVPPTNIADGSLPWAKLEGSIVRSDIIVDVDGVDTLISWGVYGLDGGGNELLQFGITPDRLIVSEHIATIEAAVATLAPLMAYLANEGIPVQKIAGTEVADIWVEIDGEPKKMLWGKGSADGTAVHLGILDDGQVFAPSLAIPDGGTDYILYPQDQGGIGRLDRDSTGGEGTEIIGDGENWSDLENLRDDIWTGRSDRISGTAIMHRIDVLNERVIPLNQNILWHFGGAGQSLRLGTNSVPRLTTGAVHPGFNLMFSAGSQAGAQGVVLNGATLTAFSNFLETTSESPAPGCLNRFQTRNLALLGSNMRILYSNHADGGTTYAQIKKGTQPYANGLTEITRAVSVAAGLGWNYIYPATLMTHGETDQNVGTSAATYEANMKEFLTDIAADVQGITGQAYVPYLFISQTSCNTFYNDVAPTIALGQLAAALTEERIVMVCPKYFLNYVDGLHLTNVSSRMLGEYDCKAMEQTLFGKGKWLPLYPISAVQDAGSVTVTFHVPAGVLAFDDVSVSDPGNYGFELSGATITGTPTIAGNTVVIPKSGTATAVQYAYTGVPGNPSGPTTGSRGCLRDTDPAISQFNAAPLYNWCVHFSLSI